MDAIFKYFFPAKINLKRVKSIKSIVKPPIPVKCRREKSDQLKITTFFY